jgi:hypothetical protein
VAKYQQRRNVKITQIRHYDQENGEYLSSKYVLNDKMRLDRFVELANITSLTITGPPDFRASVEHARDGLLGCTTCNSASSFASAI